MSERNDLAARQAGRWFARLNAHQIDSATDDAFRRWIEAAPQHEQAFEHCELAWELAGDLADDPEIETELRAIAERVQAAQFPRQPKRFRDRAFAFAAAAGIAIAGIVTWQMTQLPSIDYETAVGEQRRIVLEDGSRVILNTDSRIRVAFDSRKRNIVLDRGEATFEVAKNPDRPFEVHAGGGVATAVGTHYNVLDTGRDVEVTVMEGRVRVEPTRGMEEDAPVLAAGQAVSFGRDGFARPVRYADAKRIAAWHAERLEFDGIALADAVAEANRYTDTKLRVADPSIAGIEISGVFRVGDIAGFVAALNAAFGIRAVGGGSEILLMPPLKLTRGHADLQPGEAAAAD